MKFKNLGIAAFLFLLLSVSLYYSREENQPKPSLTSFLPEKVNMYHLVGKSNRGLWNDRLKLGIKNEDDIFIIVETITPFSDIQVGDIIVFNHPQAGGVVCHPVISRNEKEIHTKGYNNKESETVTISNYRGKVNRISETPDGPWLIINTKP